MSRLGFNKIIAGYDQMEKSALEKMMKEAQKEFKNNFDTESANGTGWKPVKRPVPPPILNVTGALKTSALSPANVRYSPGKAVLTVDPLANDGSGYADIHQKGKGKTSARPYLTQSARLTSAQKEIILQAFDKLAKYGVSVS